MPEETNNKKLQYLKRDEIRTMEKDMSRLREQESEVVREKMAQIKSGEEMSGEAEEMEQLKRAAEEREKMELEEKHQEEELKRLKEARAASAESDSATAAKEEERERDLLRARLRESQLKEEEDRRKFIESVAAKSEGLPAGRQGRAVEENLTPPVPPPYYKPVPPLPADLPAEAPAGAKEGPIPERPVPPPAPPTPLPADLPAEAPAGAKEGAPPKKPFKFPLPSLKFLKLKIPSIRLPKVQLPGIQLPRVTGYFPGKPSIFEKIWIRVVVSLFVLAILATLVTFWYWYLVVREEKPQQGAPPPLKSEQEEQKPTEVTKPPVIDRILTTGYHLPQEPRSIDTIIIHSVYNNLGGDSHSIEGIIEEYRMYKVAAHYLIAQQGTIYQTAPDKAISYHAGIGQMPDGRNDVNNFSLGIELVNTKEEMPTETQYQSLVQLVKYLQKEYNIPTENILGHKDIAPGRKTDPWNFDLEYFKSLLE